MAAQEYNSVVQQLYVSYFGRPADFYGLKNFTEALDAMAAPKTFAELTAAVQAQPTGALANLVAGFSNSEESIALYGNDTSDVGISKFVAAVYQNFLGREADTEGFNFWVDAIVKGGLDKANAVAAIVDGATKNTTAQGLIDAQVVANKLSVANSFTAALDTPTELNAYAGTAAANAARSLLAEVDEATDLSSFQANIDVAVASIVGGSPVAGTMTLTDGIDNIAGRAGNDTISAPVVQNQNGELVNSLETGDVINGGAGTDTLNAVLTNSQGSDTDGAAPAISATLSGIEVVNYRSQFDNNDGSVNSSHIDAELHSGVQQYWSDNSRADLQIEDIRQLPEQLTFGMRQTDPGVSYSVYFDPAQLAADRGTAGDSSLTLTLVDNSAGAEELENFPVNGVVFKLGGTQYTVQSADALGATYAEFVTNLTAELRKVPALKDVTVTLNANNTVTLTDPAGAAFEVVGYTWVGNIVPSGGELQWNQVVGAAVTSEAPITTNVVLDAVGRTAQGGTLDIGSMADGGVEVFNVSVDRSSWLNAMESRENFGDGDRHLETVNLTSIGAQGNLDIGAAVVGSTGELDGRVENGLTDVREVLNEGFTGELNYGVRLTDESIGRYLDVATGEVVFAYEGGAGNDNISIVDDSNADALSNDADFAMDVTLGAGNDRLNLDMANVDNVSIDGGTGTNTLAVARSHGTAAANTFEGFANFQTYEVEGDEATLHDFTSMAGVTTVNVATVNGAATTLRDLPAANGVVITGKNQTLAGANASNANQSFGAIAINGADATATDTTLRVTLQNTARLDGVLTVAELSVGNLGADVNPIRTLELVSAGQRNTENVVTDINAALVNTFNLSGTQNLTANITAAANSTATNLANRASLVVTGADLTGDLELSIDGGVVSGADAGSTSTVTLTGTAGTADRLTLDGGLAITTDTTVSAFETVRFVDTDGEVDVTNFSGVTVYDIESADAALAMEGMKGNERINVNIDASGNVADVELTFVAAGQATSNVLDLEFRAADLNDSETTDVSFDEILVQDFRTISLDLGGYADQGEDYVFDLNLVDENGVADEGVGYAADEVYARNVVVIGGGDEGAAGSDDDVDTVDLGTLSNVISNIDVSGYVGQITLDIVAYEDTVVDRNVTVSLNGYGATLSESILAGGVDGTIVTYEFTTDAVAETEDVLITGFNAFNAADIDLTNLSVLDLSALGVGGLADLTIVDADGDPLTDGVLITSNDGLNFQIGLVGVALAELSNENFKFAG
ncbi:MAG: DUF4214 domain-containing protein [Massilia sp.]|uniref:DUF4214 domain-containing protein n=1 Tax=Massilia sp. TaxID=1882437 RepID=UPI002FC99367